MSKGKPGDSPLSVYKTVAAVRLAESHGMDAAVGRYFWLSRGAVEKIVQQAREILRGQQTRQASVVARSRRTTPEQEDAAVAAALRHGSVHRASKELGLTHTFVLTLFRERGLPIPRLSREERVKAVLARQARAAAS